MLLITSGKYIEAELASEFGNIPPCFLPIGNKRLFEHQLSSLDTGQDIFVSIPESYSISEQDQSKLNELGVLTIRIPKDLSLENSILHCLKKMQPPEDTYLEILHGDTLIPNFKTNFKDFVSVAHTNENYNWASVKRTKDSFSFSNQQQTNDTEVLSGYFCFSSINNYIKSLTSNQANFITSLNHYSNKYVNLQPVIHNEWLDFGHIHTYFSSKAKLTTQRSFNDLLITKKTVTKSSHKSFKMQCESNWFKQVPDKLKLYTPKLISSQESSYTIEYLYLSTLSEIFVFGELPPHSWNKIFDSCEEFLETCKNPIADSKIKNTVNDLFHQKTIDRITEFKNSNTNSIDLNCKLTLNGEELPSIHEQVSHCLTQIRESKVTDLGVMHGDFCFSNILYDFRAQSITCIDPRGHLDEKISTIYGDRRYDVAKFYHSVIGDYDLIIAGRFKLESYQNEITFHIDNPRADLKKIILQRNLANYPVSEIYPIMINLFYSMLPLHSDNKKRQTALLANAARLFKEYYL